VLRGISAQFVRLLCRRDELPDTLIPDIVCPVDARGYRLRPETRSTCQGMVVNRGIRPIASHSGFLFAVWAESFKLFHSRRKEPYQHE